MRTLVPALHSFRAKPGLLIAAAAAASLALPNAALAQKANLATGFQVVSTSDATQLLTSILGTGITAVGAPTLIGQSDADGAQQGLFTTIGPSILGGGFNSGIVLTSGYASNVVGPNESSLQGKDWGSAGDADLDAFTGGTTGDTNSLSFDFVIDPTITQLGFNYVFGSEEYNEFVDSQYNDAFGFYVDGKNIAVLPGSGDPVTINNVNLGKNSAFFRDNTTAGSPLNTELDGLTTTLYADVFHSLDPSLKVHHIKLTIADTRDTVLDSAVFIQGNSFSNITPPMDPVPEAGTSTGLGIGLAVLAGMTLAARRRRAKTSPA